MVVTHSAELAQTFPRQMEMSDGVLQAAGGTGMTFLGLLLRNLRFHWRGNFAVFLGVAVGTAVLTGALLVGDSLRGSLREVTERQLGFVEFDLVTQRFFRQKLAEEISSKDKGSPVIVPVIALQASAEAHKRTGEKEGPDLVRRAGRVSVWGVTDDFRKQYGRPYHWPAEGTILNASLAHELGVGSGDSITLFLPRAGDVPRESLLGRREKSDVLTEVELKVAAVVQEDDTSSQFSLNPSPAAPRNVFVPLALLQEQLKQQGRVNALLVSYANSPSREGLGRALGQALMLDDWGLTVQDPESRTQTLFNKLDKSKAGKLTRPQWRNRVSHSLAELADADGVLTRETVLDYYRRRGYLSLESRQMLLEPAVADAALKVAKDMGWTAAPTLVYLANTIKEGDREIPYSVVAALDPALPPPLGPFLPPDVKTLKDDEIVLAGWKDSPLPGKVGDPITLTYFQPEEQGKLGQRSAIFRLAGVLPLTGVADDPDLTPEFPGITDKLSLKDWNPPFPYDNSRVKKPDEEYWNEHRTTPKAYVTLKAGQGLWHSRFGKPHLHPPGAAEGRRPGEGRRRVSPPVARGTEAGARRLRLRSGA